MEECLLEIPADETSVTLSTTDGGRLFVGDEFQALRVSNLLPPVAGGSSHRHYLKGQFERREDHILVQIPDGYDLDSTVELEIYGDVIKRIAVCWP
jgi:hypothetical protein